jgi:chromosome segregation ATPase
MSSENKTDPPRKRPSLRPVGHFTESGRWVPLNSGRFSAALEAVESADLEALIDEREQLREQLAHVKDLSSRLIDRVDAQEQQIASLQTELKRKESLIHDLEVEAADLIAHASNREQHVKALQSQLEELSSTTDEMVTLASKREDRISQLESFLKMIADADRRDD